MRSYFLLSAIVVFEFLLFSESLVSRGGNVIGQSRRSSSYHQSTAWEFTQSGSCSSSSSYRHSAACMMMPSSKELSTSTARSGRCSSSSSSSYRHSTAWMMKNKNTDQDQGKRTLCVVGGGFGGLYSALQHRYANQSAEL